jgi:hypothetical protein
MENDRVCNINLSATCEAGVVYSFSRGKRTGLTRYETETNLGAFSLVTTSGE